MYIDLITRIRNGQLARHETVKVPFSKMDLAVAELLVKQGYLEAAVKKGRMPRRIIELQLKYRDTSGVLSDAIFLSKPSRRIYSSYRNLRPLKRGGHTLAVVSTPEGIMSFNEARKKKLGGELLFEVW